MQRAPECCLYTACVSLGDTPGTVAHQYSHTVFSLSALILFLFQSPSGTHHSECHPSRVPLGSSRLSGPPGSLDLMTRTVLRSWLCLTGGCLVGCTVSPGTCAPGRAASLFKALCREELDYPHLLSPLMVTSTLWWAFFFFCRVFFLPFPLGSGSLPSAYARSWE